MQHTVLGSCTHIPNKYYLKNNYLTLRSKVKVPWKSLWYATHRLMVMHPHTKYHWSILKDKNVMARTRKYYLKNNYLTLRSKVKVPRRSLRYVTHRLMVMHPHYKYYWPISKDKNVMAWTRKYYLKTIIWPWGQRSRSHEGHYGMWHTALWSCTHIPNKYYLKTIIWSWGQRSRSHEGHYGTWHTALWSCTHIPNIIDQSRKTKMLWLGQ